MILTAAVVLIDLEDLDQVQGVLENQTQQERKVVLMPRSTKNLALQKIESHEKLCRIMQKQTHEKIEKLETSIERIEKILIGCAGALLVGMGGVITALIFRF
jgi:hypothetical protein